MLRKKALLSSMAVGIAVLAPALASLGACGGPQTPNGGGLDLDAVPASFFAPAPPSSLASGTSGAGNSSTGNASGNASGSASGNGTGAGNNGSSGAGAGTGTPAWAQGCPAVAVTHGYGRLKVTLDGDVFFDFDKYALKKDALSMLGDIKRDVIDAHPQAALVVEGHTDSVGTDAYNDTLSQQRAGSVATWLQSNGIAAQRIQKRGYGERHPRVPNDTDENRAKNRRVEIVILTESEQKPPAPPKPSCEGNLACCELAKSEPSLAASCIGKTVTDDLWGNDLAARELSLQGGALSLTSCTTTRSGAIWITSTNENKVSKLDERTGEEIFRVPTFGKFPHRTALATDNSVWITNRESRSYIHMDENGEVLCSSPYDTCMTRAAAVDVDGFGWIGCYTTGTLIKVHPTETDGTTKVKADRKSPEITVPKCKELARVQMGQVAPYGLVADRKGTLWVATNRRGPIAHVDARKAEVIRYVDVHKDPMMKNKCWGRYGIAIDRDGNPWYANYTCGSTVKLDGSTGKVLGYFEPPRFEKKDAKPKPPKPKPPGEAEEAKKEDEGEAKKEYEPVPVLRAIGFDRRGHAWLGDNRNSGYVYEFASDGTFVKRVNLKSCLPKHRSAIGLLGTGSDSEGHMWTVMQHAGIVAEYTTDGEILGCYPKDGTPKFVSPYTYSDFTGSSVALATGNKGRVTVTLAHDTAVTWRMLAMFGVTPARTSICFRARTVNGGTFSRSSALRCVKSASVSTMSASLDDLGLPPGDKLEIEFELDSSNRAASPILYNVAAAATP